MVQSLRPGEEEVRSSPRQILTLPVKTQLELETPEVFVISHTSHRACVTGSRLDGPETVESRESACNGATRDITRLRPVVEPYHNQRQVETRA